MPRLGRVRRAQGSVPVGVELGELVVDGDRSVPYECRVLMVGRLHVNKQPVVDSPATGAQPGVGANPVR